MTRMTRMTINPKTNLKIRNHLLLERKPNHSR